MYKMMGKTGKEELAVQSLAASSGMGERVGACKNL